MVIFAPAPATFGLQAMGLAPPPGMSFSFTALPPPAGGLPPPPQVHLQVPGLSVQVQMPGVSVSVGGGGQQVTLSPLAGAPAGAASAPWKRHNDGTDTWYTHPVTGEASWSLPPGATFVD
jgi:hypothetical protein